MILQHWGLAHDPFPPKTGPRGYLPTACLEEAIARLEFLVNDRRSLGAIHGPSGTGKTLALELLAHACHARGISATRQNMVGLSAKDFLHRLCTAWTIPVPDGESRTSLWRRLEDTLLERRILKAPTVLLLDDADESSRHCVSTVLRLISSDAAVTVVLANNESSSWILRALGEQVDLRIELAVWSQRETADFVIRALRRAGAPAAIFSEESLAVLHHACGGNPRAVNRLAGLCLLAGAGQGADSIGAPLVESIHREFAVAPLTAAA